MLVDRVKVGLILCFEIFLHPISYVARDCGSGGDTGRLNTRNFINIAREYAPAHDKIFFIGRCARAREIGDDVALVEHGLSKLLFLNYIVYIDYACGIVFS